MLVAVTRVVLRRPLVVTGAEGVVAPAHHIFGVPHCYNLASMTEDIKAHTMPERIEELRERKELAQKGERPDSIAKQHERGKLTARERCVALLDEGSFVEFDQL